MIHLKAHSFFLVALSLCNGAALAQTGKVVTTTSPAPGLTINVHNYNGESPGTPATAAPRSSGEAVSSNQAPADKANRSAKNPSTKKKSSNN